MRIIVSILWALKIAQLTDISYALIILLTLVYIVLAFIVEVLSKRSQESTK